MEIMTASRTVIPWRCLLAVPDLPMGTPILHLESDNYAVPVAEKILLTNEKEAVPHLRS